MKLSCEQANHVCDKSQYKEASLWEKVKLSLHLLFCGVCRNYTVNNTKLTKVLKTNKIEVLGNEAKNKLKTTFEQELAKQKQ